jgi:predicted outer membrane repeat protein
MSTHRQCEETTMRTNDRAGFARRRFFAVAVLQLIVLFGLGQFAQDALAACSLLKPPPEFYVGDIHSDAACTHDNIQAAIDAATCLYGTKIFITHEHLYTNQHLNVDNKNVTLIGRADGDTCGPASVVICNPTCPPPILAPLATISGSSGGSVINVSNASSVTLQYLDIRDGDNSGDGGSGGGIYFGGHGSLTLLTSVVEHNHAAYGGGIDVTPSGGSATLTLGANTMVTFNVADVSGGGIRLEGSSNLAADEDRTLIGYNEATSSFGGGLEVIGPARADIGSPGLALDGVIYANQAQYGGGIAVFGGPNKAKGYVNLYTTDPRRPVTVSGNSADQHGGAVFARGDPSDADGVANFCATNARIVENAALDGAALYLDHYYDNNALSNGYFNRAVCGGPAGVACARGIACNEIAGNESRDPSTNTLTGGAAIVVFGTLDADRVALHDNNVGTLVFSYQAGPKLSNCLISHNLLSYNVFYRDAGYGASVDQCTIADNSIGGAAFGDQSPGFFTDSPTLTNSIVFQPGIPAGWVPQVHYTLVDHSYGGDLTVETISNPGFVDPANGDYHLRLNSKAVDYAGGIGLHEPDLDGNPHEIDVPTVADTFGPRDVGAYERQSPYACDNSGDYLFCSSFQ